MKKIIFVLPLFFTVFAVAQTEESFSVKLKSPKMDEMINKLWLDLPTDCTLPSNAKMDDENGDENCAGIALKHFRQIINKCKMKDAFKEAIKLEFKLIKLIPVGKVAGTILDIADLTSKALSANSPEALEGDLVKYGFGKVVGDQVVGKLKKVTKVPDGEEGDALGNLTKLFYKQLWDKAKNAIFPKAEKYDCQSENETCTDNINISIEPYTGDDAKVVGKLIFSANGDCKCQLPCAPGQAGNKLGQWSVHGEMLIVIDKAEIVEEGFISKSKVLQVTLKALDPSYHVQAKCNCGHTSNMQYERNSYFAGLGLINEDAGDRFNTYGVNVAYTHLTNSSLGITGDAGLYFGSNNSVNYTKIQLLAGISYLPATTGNIILAPHILAGIANINSKFTVGSTSVSGSSTSFAAAIGADVITGLNKKTGIGVRLDYNPVFAKGKISHNIRLSAGISNRRKKK